VKLLLAFVSKCKGAAVVYGLDIIERLQSEQKVMGSNPGKSHW